MCDDFILDLSQSYNFGGRDPLFIDCIGSGFRFTNELVLTIPYLSMTSLSTVTITCQIMTWYQQFVVGNFTFERLNQVIPVVTIQGPNLWRVLYPCLYFSL